MRKTPALAIVAALAAAPAFVWAHAPARAEMPIRAGSQPCPTEGPDIKRLWPIGDVAKGRTPHPGGIASELPIPD